MSSVKEILTRRPLAATIRLTVPAGAARPAPPVGPALGQYRLNLMAFCKDFNARTQKYKPDTPMSVTITAFKDNTFEFTVKSPSVTWYLKKAAGIESGSSRPGHVVASVVTLKHIYEIAKADTSVREEIMSTVDHIEARLHNPEFKGIVQYLLNVLFDVAGKRKPGAERARGRCPFASLQSLLHYQPKLMLSWLRWKRSRCILTK